MRGVVKKSEICRKFGSRSHNLAFFVLFFSYFDLIGGEGCCLFLPAAKPTGHGGCCELFLSLFLLRLLKCYFGACVLASVTLFALNHRLTAGF